MKFKDKLIGIGACVEAVEWVGDMSLEEAWEKCHRGDWMLWLYKKMYPENLRGLTLAKGHCANTVRHLMQDERSLKAVDVAIAFGEGKATGEDLAAYTALAATKAVDATAYAVDAVDAAVRAADAAAYAAYTALAATKAADAVVVAVAVAEDAREKNRQLTADICRKYLKIKEEIKK